MGAKRAPAKSQPPAKAGKPKGSLQTTKPAAPKLAAAQLQLEPPVSTPPRPAAGGRLRGRIIRYLAVHLDQTAWNVLAGLLVTALVGGSALIVIVYYAHSGNNATASPTIQQLSSATSHGTPTFAPTPTPMPTESPEPTFARMSPYSPPEPTLADVHWLTSCPDDPREGCDLVTVTWEESDPAGVTARIYALTRCLHPGATCVTKADDTDPSDLKYITQVPASQGSVPFPMRHESSPYLLHSFFDPPGLCVYAYLVQAVNVHGGSRLSIAGTLTQPEPEQSGISSCP